MSTSTKPTARCGVRMINNAAVYGRSKCKVKAASSSARASLPCSKQRSRKDYYEVLSLEHSPAVGVEEIKRAYRRLALRYHPDLCPPSQRAESTVLFVELRRAYETLSDPARRVRYDAELRRTDSGEAGARTSVELFPSDVWEAQLRALHARSERRQRARNGALYRFD